MVYVFLFHPSFWQILESFEIVMILFLCDFMPSEMRYLGDRGFATSTDFVSCTRCALLGGVEYDERQSGR